MVVELPVNILIGKLLRFAKENEPVVGVIFNTSLVVRVNIPVHTPIFTCHVIVCKYPELVCPIAFILFPLYTSSPVVHKFIRVVPE